MIAFLLQMLRLLRSVRDVLADPEGRALGVLVGIHLLIGTAFYSLVEGWGWLDALYFCVTILSTVGLGDLAPQTDAGKLFTVAYILTGVGLLASFIAMLAATTRDRRARQIAAEADGTPSPDDGQPAA